MSFLDKIKQQATDVATTVAEKTQETAKTGQIQIQLRNLKSEEKDALVALGRETYRLHQEGPLDGAKAADTLDSLAASVNDLRSQIAAKEQEIADKKRRRADGRDRRVRGRGGRRRTPRRPTRPRPTS